MRGNLDTSHGRPSSSRTRAGVSHYRGHVPTIAVAVHNLCHDLNKADTADDLAKSAKHATVGLVCERSSDPARAAFSDFRDRDDIGAYVPDGGPGRDPIWWATETWQKIDGSAGWMKTHDGKEGVSPDRFVTWQGLTHRGSGARLLFVNTHAINGYAKSGPDAPGHQDYRDRSAKKHWNKTHDKVAKFADAGWHSVVFGGDINCEWDDRGEPWYPGPKLDGLLRTPKQGGILVCTCTKGSAAGDMRAESLNAKSDHDIKVTEFSW